MLIPTEFPLTPSLLCGVFRYNKTRQSREKTRGLSTCFAESIMACAVLELDVFWRCECKKWHFCIYLLLFLFSNSILELIGEQLEKVVVQHQRNTHE